MTAVVIDARPHAVALLAAANEQLANSTHNAYAFDRIPGTPRTADAAVRSMTLPPIYAAITVARRYLPPVRGTGETGLAGWRAICRYVGRTENEARWMQAQLMAALNERVLVVAGVETTPLQYQPGEPPEWDEKAYAGRDFYEYVTAI